MIYQCIVIQSNYSWIIKCIILKKIEIWFVGEFPFFPKNITGVGSEGVRGAAAPPKRWMQGAVPPYKFASMGIGTRCEIKLPVVIHSGMAQKCIEFFFAPAPR